MYYNQPNVVSIAISDKRRRKDVGKIVADGFGFIESAKPHNVGYIVGPVIGDKWVGALEASSMAFDLSFWIYTQRTRRDPYHYTRGLFADSIQTIFSHAVQKLGYRMTLNPVSRPTLDNVIQLHREQDEVTEPLVARITKMRRDIKPYRLATIEC